MDRSVFLVSLALAVALDGLCERRAHGAAPDATFAQLDSNGDEVLSGREVRDVRHYDRDDDGDISLAEFNAGRKRERWLDLATESAAAFRTLDENGDELLSGRERHGIERYDADGDGDITRVEFEDARAKARRNAASRPGETVPTATVAPVVRRDPKLSAWDDQLRKQFDTGRKWAVLIGINKYEASPLRFCASDAKRLSETLIKDCGYSAERVLLLTDEQEDRRLHPTKANLQEHVKKTLAEIEKNDTVLVFFSGHGFLSDGQSFLCPIDHQSSQARLTGWSVDELRSSLHSCAAAQKILVLDCCHAGGVTSAFGASPQEIGNTFTTAQGLITFAACRTNQVSRELAALRQGAFTESFCRGLAGEADADGNQTVDSDEIYRHVLAEVPAGVAEFYPDAEQTPVRIIGQDVVGVFAMARGSGGLGDRVPGSRRLRPGESFENSIGMKVVVVSAGIFARGSAGERGHGNDESLHPVRLSTQFGVGAFEVTQSEYARVMGKNPSWYSSTGGGSSDVDGVDTSRFPVEQVSRRDAIEFCRRLSLLPAEAAASRVYRLPTEAEWEYACRATTLTPFHTGETISPRDANIRGDQPYGESPSGPSLGRPTMVAAYAPNRFGLYDMHGNVAEWCLDHYALYSCWSSPSANDIFELVEQHAADPRKARAEIATNPTGADQGDTYVFRGGSFHSDVTICRSAARRSREPEYQHRAVGFRVVCQPPR